MRIVERSAESMRQSVRMPTGCEKNQATHLLTPRVPNLSMMFIVTVFGWRYLSNAACLIRPRLLCAYLRRVEDHDTLLHYFSRLKKTCVRQVVLDKSFPLIIVTV